MCVGWGWGFEAVGCGLWVGVGGCGLWVGVGVGGWIWRKAEQWNCNRIIPNKDVVVLSVQAVKLRNTWMSNLAWSICIYHHAYFSVTTCVNDISTSCPFCYSKNMPVGMQHSSCLNIKISNRISYIRRAWKDFLIHSWINPDTAISKTSPHVVLSDIINAYCLCLTCMCVSLMFVAQHKQNNTQRHQHRPNIWLAT